MKRATADTRVAQVAISLAFFEDGDFHAFFSEAQAAGETGEAAADDEGFVGVCGVHEGSLPEKIVYVQFR